MFKAVHYMDILNEEVKEGSAKGVALRWLITKEDGAENFAMRLFEIEPNGQTPLHSHDWEHEVFILSGKGLVMCDNSEKEVTSGYAVFIPPNIQHCFKNAAKEKLSFLCLIPYRK